MSAELLSLSIKAPHDTKIPVAIDAAKTVLDLKALIAARDPAYPADRQRLIYSGRVLKDDDSLASYKIKSGHTIHMVRAAAQHEPAAAAAAVPSSANIQSGQGSANPFAALTGARYAGYNLPMPSREAFGPDGGLSFGGGSENLEEMATQPGFRESMNAMLSDPAFVDHLIHSAGLPPHMRNLLQNENFRNMLFDPNVLRQMSQFESAMGGPDQMRAAFPAPGVVNQPPDPDSTATATTTTTTSPTATATAPAPPNEQSQNLPRLPNLGGLDPAFMRQILAMSTPGTEVPAGAPNLGPQNFSLPNLQSLLEGGTFGGPVDNRPPEERYESQLRQLNDMGFCEFDRNVAALRRSGGSVQGAIEFLLSDAQ
ncbi:Deubiquitination-protection protein dph1 [Neolecta irregularis DAH-3]|uniref:Deubiquitination-protection protein dph1 n=1 Tax=Neolecta irregularis (strain DAH-3) TaxID=1198029 RepID=A0A1U7LIJ3_NEOID|nr:Deubiquitination-protection protein dph1 [Neolecta irregularis DAH-3]|eukprot:OLL22372.1 Deubiquitination-protection protein dph1 [Neolecta irregularis DAH-3]